MNRRSALASLIGGAASVASANRLCGAPKWVFNPHVHYYGAEPPIVRRADRARFYREFSAFRGAAKASKTNVFLHHNLARELGEIAPHDQTGIFDEFGNHTEVGEGDCLAHAVALGGDILAATNIHELGKQEKWLGKTSVEMVYAGSRIEIGQQSDPKKVNRLAGRAGSRGVWGARFANEFGFLHRQKYTRNGHTIDLTGYSPDRSRLYRDAGVPDWLEPICRQHPVKSISNVLSGEEALDAICARQVVVLCSSYAFHDTRDSLGFSDPYLGGRWGGGGRKEWRHAMLLSGAVLAETRRGGVVHNSHGVWNEGPRPFGLPEGAFCVDDYVLDLMVKDWYDCYALSLYTGANAKRIRHKLYRR